MSVPLNLWLPTRYACAMVSPPLSRHDARPSRTRGAGLGATKGVVVVVGMAVVVLAGCAAPDGRALPPPGSVWDGQAEDATDGASDAGIGQDAQGCAPRTCSELGAQCGSVPDPCGGIVNCGTCPSGLTCGGGGPNQCGTTACSPKTCVQLNASCGFVSDGCSEALSCGSCGENETCGGGGVPNQCGCTPKTCTSLGADCGSAPDGCGGILECGDCDGGEICGGGGPNRCGSGPCEPLTCAAVGAECGQLPDECGGVLSCGSCSLPDTCGGEGVAHRCGCTPTTCAAQGAGCGSVPDTCGETLSCGECAYGTCVANKCSCTPTTCAAQGAQCGSIADGCGGTLDCGSCPGTAPCITSTHTCQLPDCANKRCGASDGIGGTCMPGSGCCGGMEPGYGLPKGAGINSCQGVAHLEHQSDGNLVVYQYSTGQAIWNSATAGANTAVLAMQTDGNLVLYGPSNEVFWLTDTANHAGTYAAIQDDCNFVLYQGGTAIWATYKTCQ